tara:strand:+ start:171 stop:386 length:216 start_codon:yes stop_codon:yes gene_type:complete
MQLGKVVINLEYVVDLDNKEMVAQAQDALYEDLMSAYKYNGLANWIGIREGGEGLSESDIPEFLLEEELED